MKRRLYSFKADLLTELKDPDYAAQYLSASMDDSVETFLMALRNVTEARKGMAKAASEAEVNRENLYRMLSDVGNPRLRNLYSLLSALGLRIRVEPRTTVHAKTRQGGASNISVTISASTNEQTGIEEAQSSEFVDSLKSQSLFHRFYMGKPDPVNIYQDASPQPN